MADIFCREEAIGVLRNRSIAFFGDSNMRAMYKDMLQLVCHNHLLSQPALRSKLETSFLGDVLVSADNAVKHNGRNFVEEREFQNAHFSASYYFITKCFSEYVTDSVTRLVRRDPPDVVVYNSCLWDLTRWGPKGEDAYKENVPKLMRFLKDVLPKHCLVIWCTTLPVSQMMKGGFLLKEVEFLKHSLRFNVMEANTFASGVVDDHGYDVLDLHYYLRYEIHRRAGDGIHWCSQPVRHMTNLLLTHIALAWNVGLPKHFESQLLESVIRMDTENVEMNAQPFFSIDFPSDNFSTTDCGTCVFSARPSEQSDRNVVPRPLMLSPIVVNPFSAPRGNYQRNPRGRTRRHASWRSYRGPRANKGSFGNRR